MLLAKRYAPRSFEEIEGHRSQELESLCNSKCIPHILLYGPSGSGRLTNLRAFLRKFYGEYTASPDTVILKTDTKEIELNVLKSQFHTEFNLEESGNSDRLIICELLKDTSNTRNVDTNTIKFIVLHNSDALSFEAQSALRRIIEKCSVTCRFVLIAQSLSRIIPAIRSRMFCIRFPSMPNEAVERVLSSVARSEGINEERIREAVDCSNGNLARALIALEGGVVVEDWSKNIDDIVKLILGGSRDFSKARTLLYSALGTGLGSKILYRELVKRVLTKVDDELKGYVSELASLYDERLQRGTKAIIHFEAFLLRTVEVINSFNSAFS